MRISDWSSDVCSSDLPSRRAARPKRPRRPKPQRPKNRCSPTVPPPRSARLPQPTCLRAYAMPCSHARSEEHTSELQSLMRISYAVCCLKKKKKNKDKKEETTNTH